MTGEDGESKGYHLSDVVIQQGVVTMKRGSQPLQGQHCQRMLQLAQGGEICLTAFSIQPHQ